MKLSFLTEGFLKYKKSIKNAGFYFIASLIGMGISLLINPLMALNLSHEDYALMGYFTSFNSLFSPIIAFSLIVSYSRRYFLFDFQQRIRLRNTLVIALLFFSLITSVISIAALYVYVKINQVTFPFWPYAILSVSSLYFTNFYSFMLVELRMSKNAKKYALLFITRAVVAALLAILLVAVWKGGAFGKMLAASLSALIFGIYDLKKLLTKWEFDKAMFFDALKFCWPLALAGTLSYFFTGVDRALLEPLGNTHQLGSYNVAIQIAGYLAIFNTTLGQTFQPDIFKSIAQKNKMKTIKIVVGISLMNLIPIILFVIFAPFLIKLLTAGRYTDSTDFARIISLRNITDALYYSLSTIITGYGFSKIILYNRIIGTMISLGMFNVLISHYGFYGAAWGQVFSYFGLCVLSGMFILYKLLQGRMLKNI